METHGSELQFALAMSALSSYELLGVFPPILRKSVLNLLAMGSFLPEDLVPQFYLSDAPIETSNIAQIQKYYGAREEGFQAVLSQLNSEQLIETWRIPEYLYAFKNLNRGLTEETRQVLLASDSHNLMRPKMLSD